MEEKVFADVGLSNAADKAKGDFILEFYNPLCCIKSAIYMLDTAGKVVEDFNPTMTKPVKNEIWKLEGFTMNDVENWGCESVD